MNSGLLLFRAFLRVAIVRSLSTWTVVRVCFGAFREEAVANDFQGLSADPRSSQLNHSNRTYSLVAAHTSSLVSFFFLV